MLLALALLITAFCSAMTMPVSAAAKVYKSTPVSSKWVASGDYKVLLKNNELKYKGSSGTQVLIAEGVESAFLYDREVLYKTADNIMIYSLKDETRRVLNMAYTGEAVERISGLKDVQIAGFTGTSVYYLAPAYNRLMYRYDINTNVSERVSYITDGPANNAYIYNDCVYLKENIENLTSRPGPLKCFNITKNNVATLVNDVTVAYTDGKRIYYAQYAPDTDLLTAHGIVTIVIKSCDMKGGNVKNVAKVKKVNLEGEMSLTDKKFMYKREDGNFCIYKFASKNVADSNETTLKELWKKPGELY